MGISQWNSILIPFQCSLVFKIEISQLNSLSNNLINNLQVGALSALAVSEDGNFVATGSMFDGTIEIYIAYNLTV